MADAHATRIPGRWRDGFALDYHTLSSIYIGDDQFGHPQFETTRTDLGELLYRLKNRGDNSTVPGLVDAAATFVEAWNPGVDLVIPVPPSRARKVQPVLLLGKGLAERLDVPFDPDCVARVQEIAELKNVYDYDERLRLLRGIHTVDRAKVEAHRVLLLDDLYRSGATMNTVTALLYDEGGAADVFALTITRTRRNR